MSSFSMDPVSGNDFDILAYATSGMEAQRGALDVSARNIALAQTVTPDHPVKAWSPVFSTAANAMGDNPFASLVKSVGSEDDVDGDDDDDDAQTDSAAMPAFGSGAGGEGLVTMTGVKKSNMNVDAISEMVTMLNAQRAYEANASMFDLGKQIATKTIAIGQGG